MEERDLERVRERGARRAQRVVDAWSGRPRTVRTSRGEVTLERVRVQVDPESGVTYLDVTVGGPAGGDPHYRVVNPPLLVRDPKGPVEAHGVRWREDPVAALAESIGRHGGARPRRRRSGR